MIFTPTSRRRFRCWSVAGLWRVLGCESRTLEIIHLVFQGDAFSPRLDQREWTSSWSSRQCKWYKKRYKEWPSLQKCLPSNGMRHLHTLTVQCPSVTTTLTSSKLQKWCHKDPPSQTFGTFLAESAVHFGTFLINIWFKIHRFFFRCKISDYPLVN